MVTLMFSPVLHLARRSKAFSFRGEDGLFEVLATAKISEDLGSDSQLAEEDRLLAGTSHRVQKVASGTIFGHKNLDFIDLLISENK